MEEREKKRKVATDLSPIIDRTVRIDSIDCFGYLEMKNKQKRGQNYYISDGGGRSKLET